MDKTKRKENLISDINRDIQRILSYAKSKGVDKAFFVRELNKAENKHRLGGLVLNATDLSREISTENRSSQILKALKLYICHEGHTKRQLTNAQEDLENMGISFEDIVEESDSTPTHNKVFFSYYYSDKSKEPNAEVIEIKGEEAYLYTYGKHYKGRILQDGDKIIELHFTKRQGEKQGSKPTPINIRYYICHNNKFHQLDQDENFFPSLFSGLVSSNYLRVYRGLLVYQVQLSNQAHKPIQKRAEIYLNALENKLKDLPSSISLYTLHKRFNVKDFEGDLRTVQHIVKDFKNDVYIVILFTM